MKGILVVMEQVCIIGGGLERETGFCLDLCGVYINLHMDKGTKNHTSMCKAGEI